MTFLFERGVASFFALVMLLAGFLSVGEAAYGQTIFLREGASITAIQTASGDITTQQDSYLNTVSQAFSHEKGCSKLKLQPNDSANFTVLFYVAHLLDQYTVSYLVLDKSGSVINTANANSISAAAENICELIEPPSKAPNPPHPPHPPKCLPRGKGKIGACDLDKPDGKRAPRGMSTY